MLPREGAEGQQQYPLGTENVTEALAFHFVLFMFNKSPLLVATALGNRDLTLECVHQSAQSQAKSATHSHHSTYINDNRPGGMDTLGPKTSFWGTSMSGKRQE